MAMTTDIDASACTLAPQSATAALQRQLRGLRVQIAALREEDIDAIHDMRVASRRLRAVLAEHRKLFEKTAFGQARDLVRSITQGLGKARELDVTLGILEDMRKHSRGPVRYALTHVLRHTQELRTAESPRIAESVSVAASREFSRVFRLLTGNVQPPSRCYLKTAAKNVRKRHDAVIRSYGKWHKNSSPETLHRVRITFKKLRYACETYKNLYGQDLADFVEKLKDLQESLGEWHDYFVVGACIAESVSTAPPNAAAGMDKLRADVDLRMRECLDTFSCQAESFFSKHHNAQAASMLATPSRACCRETPQPRSARADAGL